MITEAENENEIKSTNGGEERGISVYKGKRTEGSDTGNSRCGSNREGK